MSQTEKFNSVRYLRIFGYTIGLTMHAVNSIILDRIYRGEILKDPDVAFYNNNRFRMLTIWNVIAQIAYSILGLSCEVLSTNFKSKPKFLLKMLKDLRNLMFSAVVFPITLGVCSYFWILYSYDPALLAPAIVYKTMPWLGNHVLHTFILPIALWELVCLPRKAPSSHLLNLAVLNLFNILFLAVAFYTLHDTGRFPYAILNSTYGTAYFYMIISLCAIGHNIYYFLQWYITKFLYGNGIIDTKKIKVK